MTRVVVISGGSDGINMIGWLVSPEAGFTVQFIQIDGGAERGR